MSEVDWRGRVGSLLERNVKDNYRQYIDEFLLNLEKLYQKWSRADKELMEKYAYNITILSSNSDKPNVVRAKTNAFYAYLVYKGYITAYKAMREKLVAGGESLYTWLRMYRALSL